MLELREAAFDEVAEGINIAVDGRLNLAVSTERNNRLDPPFCEVGTDGVAIVAFVGNQHFGLRPWLLHQGLVAFVV